jgi:hypothetical protein
VFVDSGIRASFTGASVTPRLVAAGTVEALDRGEPEWSATDVEDESERMLLDLVVGLGRAGIVQVPLRYSADAKKPSRWRTLLESTAVAAGECLIAELSSSCSSASRPPNR